MIPIIESFIRSLIGLDENDRRVDAVHQRMQLRTERTKMLLERAGKLQEILVRKTTTYYIGKAMGVIQ